MKSSAYMYDSVDRCFCEMPNSGVGVSVNLCMLLGPLSPTEFSCSALIWKYVSSLIVACYAAFG